MIDIQGQINPPETELMTAEESKASNVLAFWALEAHELGTSLITDASRSKLLQVLYHLLHPNKQCRTNRQTHGKSAGADRTAPTVPPARHLSSWGDARHASWLPELQAMKHIWRASATVNVNKRKEFLDLFHGS
jgi:hypothetical protein